MHQSVTVVQVPDGEGINPGDARRLGVAKAVGDVIRVTTPQELVEGRHGAVPVASWADRLARAGVRRAVVRDGSV